MDHHRRLDSELDVLRDRVLVLGGEAETALGRAMYALTERDSEAAREVLEGDDHVDRLEVEIDRLCIDVLALRQPAARDLRFVISVAKITPILERVADHACNIARAAIDLNDEPRLKSFPDLSGMAAVASSMPRRRSIGFAPSSNARIPSRTIACASSVAVVVPSPVWSDVLFATSRTSCAPMFLYWFVSSISRAMVIV